MAFKTRKGVMKAGIKGGGLPKLAKAGPALASAAPPEMESPPGTPDLPYKRGGKVKGGKC
jgi:hypothetical protein